MQDLTVKLVQADLHWQDPAANRRLYEQMLDTCDTGADLIILPEMFTTGFTMEAAEHAESRGEPSNAPAGNAFNCEASSNITMSKYWF